MKRRKRPSELLGQLTRRMARMDRYSAETLARQVVDIVVARRFTDGETLASLEDWANKEAYFPYIAEHFEKAIRRELNRRRRPS